MKQGTMNILFFVLKTKLLKNGEAPVENIKSLDPLLYSHLTHQKYIRIK